jgi:phospholipid-binding lipoprotein MlaA
MSGKLKTLCIALVLASATTLSGCASVAHPNDPQDPYESYNRKVFKFNLTVDRYIYRPIAKGYKAITPQFVRTGVRNFFSNVGLLPDIGNDLLQGNGVWALSDGWRFLINTTVGIGGLFDVAKHVGLPKHNQDFGLTMAKWGVKESPYFVFPFLPPGTTRDFFGVNVVGYATSPLTYVQPDWVSYSAKALDMVDQRAGLLPTDKLVDQAFDPYIFVRDAYLQNRAAKIEAVVHPEEEAPASEPTPGAGTTTSATSATQ